MIIEADEAPSESEKNANEVKEMNSTNAYLEAINGEDSFKRDSKGNIKFNKKRKQSHLNHDNDEDFIQEAVSSFHIDNNAKEKKVKKVKEQLGSEFKAKVSLFSLFTFGYFLPPFF